MTPNRTTPTLPFPYAFPSWRRVLASGTLPNVSACAHTLHYSFKVEPGQAERWRRLLAPLGDASPFCAAGGGRQPAPGVVPVNDVLCALVLRSTAAIVTPRFKRRCSFVSRTLGIAFGLLPAALRVVHGLPPFGRTPCAAVFSACCAVLTMVWWRTHALFLMVIASHYERTAAEREMLSALITEHDGPILAHAELPADQAGGEAGDEEIHAEGHAAPEREAERAQRGGGTRTDGARSADPERARFDCAAGLSAVPGSRAERVSDWPTLALDSPSAVRVFALLWKLQLSYGRAYALRMSIYNTLTCAVAALVFGFLGWAVLQHGHSRPEGGGSGGKAAEAEWRLEREEQRLLRESLPVNMSLFLAFFLGLVFYWQLRAGSRANEQARAALSCRHGGRPPQRARAHRIRPACRASARRVPPWCRWTRCSCTCSPASRPRTRRSSS